MSSMSEFRQMADKLADTIQPQIDLEVDACGPRFTFLAELMSTVLNRELEKVGAQDVDRRSCVRYIRHRIMLHPDEFLKCEACLANR